MFVEVGILPFQVDEANENSDAKRCKHNESVGNENCSGKAEHDPKESTKTASEDIQTKTEVKDYIHVRARRGQATDSHSLAERVRIAVTFTSFQPQIKTISCCAGADNSFLGRLF